MSSPSGTPSTAEPCDGGFPLPLTAFERYMRADDHPGYPMAFVLRLRFSGRLDAARLRAALLAAQAVHPLLRAVVRGDGARSAWVAADPASLPFAAGPGLAPSTGVGPSFDLAAERGWRAWIDREDDAVVVAQFHHACCDAMGALNFLEDAWLRYANLPASPADASRADALRRRGQLRLTLKDHLRRLPWDVRGTFNFMRSRPVPLAVPPGAPPVAADCRDAATFRRLPEPPGAADRRGGATVNDVLLKEFFATLSAWNRAHRAPPGGVLRVAVPTNLRALGGPTRAACNVVSMVFIDRPASHAMDAPADLCALRDEMAGIRRRNMGACLLRVLGAAAAVPGGLALFLGDSCRCTTVLSNLGVVWADSPLAGPDGRLRLGGAVLERIEFLPPIRPQSRIGIGALGYAGQLTLAINFDARTLSPHDGQAFLAAYAQRLRQSPLELP